VITTEDIARSGDPHQSQPVMKTPGERERLAALHNHEV
jgi:hypothetical protein